MNRDKVFLAVSKERDYQDKRYPEDKHSLVEFATLIERYVEEVKDDFTHRSQIRSEDACACMRKIAALAVAAMEQHGVNFR